MYISNETHEGPLRRSILQEHDILFAIAGSIGKCVVVQNDILPANTNQALAIIRLKKTENVKYIFYVLQSQLMKDYININVKGSAQPNLNLQQMSNFSIPLPPLPIQNEIVRILDNFTELSAELSAELSNELSARKKQYEYYRNELLSFDDRVEWYTLEDVFDIRNGYTPSKKIPEYWNNGTIHWFRMEDIRLNGRVLNRSIQHVSHLGVKKSGLFKKNSIMIATTATLGNHAIITCDYLSNQQLTNLTIKDTFEIKIIPMYAFYYFFIIDELCESVANFSGGIPIVDQKNFKKLRFPVPTIREQERIVAILDRFDALCNDISVDLSAEIEARQKQYEYYRDKLLSFKVLAK